jgi:hypothetical protein
MQDLAGCTRPAPLYDIHHIMVRNRGDVLPIEAALKSCGSTVVELCFVAGPSSLMIRCIVPAALYPPLRVLLREGANRQVAFEYDQPPSSLLGHFGSEGVTRVALGLDAALSNLVCREQSWPGAQNVG